MTATQKTPEPHDEGDKETSAHTVDAAEQNFREQLSPQQVQDREEALAEDESDSLYFWDQRPELTYIRDFARAKHTNPWALFMACAVRIAVCVPPNVMLSRPGYPDDPLNLYVAICGDPGTGKGVTTRLALQLVPNLIDAFEGIPASGESIGSFYAHRTILPAENGQEKPGRRASALECVTPRALIDAPEIQVIGGESDRRGSILAPQLASGFSGEALGVRLKKESDSLEVPANAYRLCAITGIQPLSAMGLFGDRQSGVGLSTRFLFAPSRDPAFPAQHLNNPASIPCFPFDPYSDAYRSLWEQFKELSHELYSAVYDARGISGLSDIQREQWHLIRFVLPPESEQDLNDDLIRKNLGIGDDGNAHLLQIRERLAAILTILGYPYRQPEIKDGNIYQCRELEADGLHCARVQARARPASPQCRGTSQQPTSR